MNPRVKRIKSDVGNTPMSTFERDLIAIENEEGNQTQSWDRPELVNFDPSTTEINFQQIEAEESMLENKTIARFFGVTEDGHSILCNITGFKHYFYVPTRCDFQQFNVTGFIHYLNTKIGSNFVNDIQIVMKENLWGYNNNTRTPFLKIILNDPAHAPKIRSMFESGQINYNGFFNNTEVTTYDNIPYIMRLMVDLNISGMSWFTLPAGKYKLIQNSERLSRCQLEVSVQYDQFISHSSEGEWLKMAPLRILSYDIECSSRKGIFPDPKLDSVIQIANVVSIYGENKPFIRNVFTLGSCSSIPGTQIFPCENENQLLLSWRNFIDQVDPDIIIGYNITNFDTPYLLERAKALKINDQFSKLGRLTNINSVVKDSTFSSKAYGTRESKVVNIDGRLQFDLLQFIQREYKLRSYTLNNVSAQFLNEQKEDVHHSIITQLQNSGPDSRRRLAIYCLKDAYLPLRLVIKLMCLVNYTEMARVTGVPFSFLLSRGQQIKVISQLFRKALAMELVVPNLRQQGGAGSESYEGATVIEPVRGYYDVPIATLDFSSLYPSIMMAHNLCYTTLTTKKQVESLNYKLDEDYIITPNGDYFIKESHRKGILPEVLKELLDARKRAKADLKKETDPFKRAVLDGRQLALKISANSVYGFTGATNGKLPCLAISSSVTAFGRDMIMETKGIVENYFSKKNNYDFDAKVIYGDTDSVMIKFGVDSLEKAMELGRIGAEEVSKHFINPIKLEFEKVYFPYLLINKKRYAGLYWTKVEKYDKMDTKGIETVRRDNCQLVQKVIETILHKILIDRDVNNAQEYVKNIISDLVRNKIDLSQLVISKQLSKSDYSAKMAHVELAERMRKRDPGSAPQLGDRVAYVITKGAKKDKAYEKSEDPIYVLDNNIPIDTTYYLENQLSKPITRIFEPIIGNKKTSQLLHGDHTRTISIAAPTSGGLMKFAVRSALCKSCRHPLKGEYAKAAVCEHCMDKLGELYKKQLFEMTHLEVKFSRLWTQCQRCQGSLHQDVICSNQDCPIFYMRKKVQKDVNECSKQLKRFNNTVW